MGHRRAGGGRDQAGDAGIAEQVQDARRRRRGAQRLVEPFPVGRLLGKEGQMAKGGETPVEAHVAPLQRPGLGRLAGKAPAAGLVLIGGVEHRVGRRPDRLGLARTPQALRLRPHDAIGAVTLQLLPIAAVDQAVVGPAGGAQHDRRRGQDGMIGRTHGSALRGRAPTRPGAGPRGWALLIWRLTHATRAMSCLGLLILV